MKRRSLLLAAPLGLGLASFSGAQSPYPSKPIRYIVPVTAGGGSDMVGRTVCERLGRVLGQTIVVDNLGGGGGVIASQTTARAPADGYTLMLGSITDYAIAPHVHKNLSFDMRRDFVPVIEIAFGTVGLVVNADLPVKNVQELIALAKAKPGQLSFASSGLGGLQHLNGEMFKQMAGVDLVHVPYKGAGPAMTDLLGGQVSMMFATAAAVAPHIAAGKLRALAVSSPERSPVMKAIPAIAETIKGYSVESWYGLFAPAGTPPEVISKLNSAVKQATQSVEFRGKLEPEGLVVSTGSAQEFDAYVKREESRWRKIVKENNIKPD